MSLLQMSYSGVVLIIGVVIIRAAAIYKLPKKVFPVLWELVLFRLLIPFPVLPAFRPDAFLDKNRYLSKFSGTGASDMISLVLRGQSIALREEGKQPAGLSNLSFWFIIWCAGAVLFAGFFLLSYLRCRMKFRMSLPVRNHYVEGWLEEHPTKRRISVRQSDRIFAPLTYGVLHPVILLPKRTERENTEQLQYILLHEYAHIRRFDSIRKLAVTAALCVHWFNPAVWVMYLLFNRDMELVCDESVVRRLGEKSKSAYSFLLIGMEEKKSGLLPLYSSFCRNVMEERILAIMKTRKATSASVLGACFLALGTAALLIASAQAGGSSPAADSRATILLHVDDRILLSGPYECVEEVKTFCEEQVRLGNMVQADADWIIGRCMEEDCGNTVFEVGKSSGFRF